MRRWDGMVEGFLHEAEVRGVGMATLKSWRSELGRFGLWLKGRRPRPSLEAVGAEPIIRYLKGRTAFHGKSTLSRIMSTLRVMGEYLVRQGVWTSNPLRWMRGPKLDIRSRLPRRIGHEDMARLWERAVQTASGFERSRMLAMLSVLYGTGLRRGELERLDFSNWRREENILEIDGRKTGHPRRVPLAPKVAECLEAWLPQRQNMLEKHVCLEEKALFINRKGCRLMAERISRMVHRLAEQEKVPLVTLHAFRHTCASDLLESGVRLPEVRQMLGHASVGTTVRYLSIADPQRREAIARHPINGILKVSANGGA